MNRTFLRMGLGGLIPLLCAFPFVVLLALPVIDLGIFRQVETVAAAVHVLSAACAFCLLLVSVGDARALKPAASGSVLAPLALAGIAALAMPLVDSPQRSLVGSMEHGIGAAWFAELAVVTLAATVLRRERPAAFAAVAWSAAASFGICLLLQLLQIPYGNDVFVPYDFREYLGVNGLIAAAALLALRGRAATVGGIAVALAAVALSGNRAAMLAALVAGAAYLILSRSAPGPARRRLAIGSVALAVGALAAISLAPPAWQSLAESGAQRGAVQSASPADWSAVQLKPYGTVWQRGVSAGMVERSVMETPQRILAGRGFGTFETVAVEHKREAPGRRLVPPYDTAATTYWDGDQKAKFHSHNLLLEAILAVGVGGGAAWLAYLAGVAMSARPRALPGAVLLMSTLVVAGSFWFIVNSALPLLAIAVAALAPAAIPRRSPAPPAGVGAAGATLGLAIGLVGFALLGAIQSASSRTIMNERYFSALPWGPAAKCVGFQAVGVPERQLNVNLYQMFVRFIEAKGAGAGEAFKERATLAANLSCLMRRYAVENGDVEAMEASLVARGRLAALFPDDDETVAGIIGPDFQGWVEDIERFLAKAPGRTDVLVPFVAWAENGGKNERVLLAERLVPTLGDGDPVKSLLQASVAKARGDAAENLRSIVRALDLGLANLRPIPLEMARGARASVR